jgi:hypothetical protein
MLMTEPDSTAGLSARQYEHGRLSYRSSARASVDFKNNKFNSTVRLMSHNFSIVYFNLARFYQRQAISEHHEK